MLSEAVPPQVNVRKVKYACTTALLLKNTKQNVTCCFRRWSWCSLEPSAWTEETMRSPRWCEPAKPTMLQTLSSCMKQEDSQVRVSTWVFSFSDLFTVFEHQFILNSQWRSENMSIDIFAYVLKITDWNLSFAHSLCCGFKLWSCGSCLLELSFRCV